MQSDEKNGKVSWWDAFVQRFAVPLLTASLGFGASQFMMRDQVLHNTQHLETVDKELAAEHQERIERDAELTAQGEKRFEYFGTMMESLIKQNTEMLALIKVQQQVKQP